MKARLAALVSLLLLAALGTATSGASFSAQSANPGNSFSAAASFCSNPSTQTVTASKDTYVFQDSPNDNFGTSSDLFAQSKSDASNRRTLVGFNLPAIPADCSVTDAKLRLFSTAAVTGRTIEAYRAGASWTEGTATWNNQPATTGAAATSASGAGWREWAVTSQVQAMYGPGPNNNGFLVRDQSEDAPESPEQKYQSRQGSPDSQDPQLVVTFG